MTDRERYEHFCLEVPTVSVSEDAFYSMLTRTEDKILKTRTRRPDDIRDSATDLMVNWTRMSYLLESYSKVEQVAHFWRPALWCMYIGEEHLKKVRQRESND